MREVLVAWYRAVKTLRSTAGIPRQVNLPTPPAKKQRILNLECSSPTFDVRRNTYNLRPIQRATVIDLTLDSSDEDSCSVASTMEYDSGTSSTPEESEEEASQEQEWSPEIGSIQGYDLGIEHHLSREDLRRDTQDLIDVIYRNGTSWDFEC